MKREARLFQRAVATMSPTPPVTNCAGDRLTATVMPLLRGAERGTVLTVQGCTTPGPTGDEVFASPHAHNESDSRRLENLIIVRDEFYPLGKIEHLSVPRHSDMANF